MRFRDYSWDDVKAMMGSKLDTSVKASMRPVTAKAGDPPTTFDSRVAWPGCQHEIRDQGKCGSCWAFAAAEVLSFRFCAVKNITVALSAQELLSCANSLKLQCKGGQPADAWKYMESPGLHVEACVPYVDGAKTENQTVHACADENTCTDSKASSTVYKAKNYYAVTDSQGSWDKNQLALRTEIVANGPVQVTLQVFSDLLSYKSGVYTQSGGYMVGYHSVKLVGWGLAQGEPYWLVANSWGKSWGESGYFRMYRGYGGDGGITNAGIAGEPVVTESNEIVV